MEIKPMENYYPFTFFFFEKKKILIKISSLTKFPHGKSLYPRGRDLPIINQLSKKTEESWRCQVPIITFMLSGLALNFSIWASLFHH